MVEFMEAFNERFEEAYPNVTVDMSVVNANHYGGLNALAAAMRTAPSRTSMLAQPGECIGLTWMSLMEE